MIDEKKYEAHSAGKWRIRTSNNYSYTPVKKTFTIKDCLGDKIAVVKWYPDAQLIADAPDLLAEIKLMQEYIEWIFNYGNSGITHYAQWKDDYPSEEYTRWLGDEEEVIE